MAQRPLMNRMTVKGTTYDIEDKYARSQIADIEPLQNRVGTLETNVSALQSGKVAKAGDTMTGNLIMSNNKQVRFSESGGAYSTVNESTNYLEIVTVDRSGNNRKIRIKSPEIESADVFSVVLVTDTGMYNMDFTGYTTFSGTSLTALANMEYTNNTAISSLTINWPIVTRGLIFGVNFSTTANFTGVRNITASGTSFTPKLIGSLTSQSVRYNMICWHDGKDYWCCAQSSAL